MGKTNNFIVRCKKSVTDTCTKGEYFKSVDVGFSKTLREVQLFADTTDAHDVVLHEYLGNNVNDKFDDMFIKDYFDERVIEDAFYNYFEILPVEVVLVEG